MNLLSLRDTNRAMNNPLDITFWVPGHPKAQGSMRAFVNPKTNKVIMPQDKKVLSWRGVISTYAMQAMVKYPMSLKPVFLELTVCLSRPKAHCYSGKRLGQIRETAPKYPAAHNTGDIEKHIRSVNDALQGVVFKDDCQVVAAVGYKVYHSQEGVIIHVTEKPFAFLREPMK